MPARIEVRATCAPVLRFQTLISLDSITAPRRFEQLPEQRASSRGARAASCVPVDAVGRQRGNAAKFLREADRRHDRREVRVHPAPISDDYAPSDRFQRSTDGADLIGITTSPTRPRSFLYQRVSDAQRPSGRIRVRCRSMARQSLPWCATASTPNMIPLLCVAARYGSTVARSL